jgi:hypothetical protein
MKKIVSLIFGILFLLFAAVQYNDPDPQVWVPIYGIAALACLMAWVGMGQWWFFAGMTVVYALAAWNQWPPVFEGFLLNEMGMKSINIELARESGGLAICAVAMGVLAYLSTKKSRPTTRKSEPKSA